MVRDENFLILMQVLSENLPKKISDYYNVAKEQDEFIEKLKSQMSSWYTDHADVINLSEIKSLIWYLVENSMQSSATAENAYMKYAENRRGAKKNWLKKIKAEYEKLSAGEECSGLLCKDANSYFSLKNMNGPVSGAYTDRKEYIDARFSEIQEWQKDKDSMLICYIYFDVLQPVQRVKAYMTEVGYFTFECIMTKMYGNLENGLFTRVPSSVFNEPFFSTQQNSFDNLSFSYEDGLGTFFEDFFPSEGVVRTTVKSIPMTKEESQDSSIIRSLQDKYKLTERAKSLDPVDLQLLATICSNLTASVLSSGTMTITLKSLARQFFNKSAGIRGRDYLLLIRRINKLAEYTLSATRRNEETKIVEKIILHFLDVHFEIPTNTQNEIKNIDNEIREVLDEKNDDLAGVSMDISETVLQIIPGKAIADAWKENSFQKVYSNTYAQIEDPKTKMFLTIMETERLKIYPKTSQTLDYSFFTNRLRFSMQASKAKGVIRDGLKTLVDRGIVVKNFEMVDKEHIKIEYIDMNDTEKMVYKIAE